MINFIPSYQTQPSDYLEIILSFKNKRNNLKDVNLTSCVRSNKIRGKIFTGSCFPTLKMAFHFFFPSEVDYILTFKKNHYY